MAHKKAAGSTKNGRDSNPQYRGVKVFGGEKVTPGCIIVRQVGSTFHAGKNVGLARDFSIYSMIDGHVKFERTRKKRMLVSVYPTP